MIGLRSKKGNDDGMISKGFYWNLGIGFPSFKITEFSGFDRVSQGVQFSLEAGTQWMFVKNDRFGFGMNVSWITIGASSYKIKNTDNKALDVHVGLLRFGPMATVGLGDNAAIDVFFNLSPTVKYNLVTFANDDQSNNLMYWMAWTPGVKLRVKKFAVGVENSFGSMTYANLDEGGGDFKVSYLNPRILLGMKF